MSRSEDTIASQTPMRTIESHYSDPAIADLYATLGWADGLLCPGNRDFYGWYKTEGGRGRAWSLAKEYDELRQNLDRVVYSTINYATPEWFVNGWESFQWGDNGREFEETPTPGYGDLRAYAPFADIDLADDVKRQRPDGDAPRETVERALALYLDAFGELAGDMNHVYALDSVGGAYAFVAPTATAPIADAFDRDARALLFEDLTDRMNDWLDGVKDDVNDAVPDAAGTFEPDLLNNKNRLYKAPMSVHSSLDGVVTPVDPENPTYHYTALEAVDTAAIADAKAWADGFTSDHTDAVSAIVANLWPNYTDDADGWHDALSDRVGDLKEERERNEQRENERPSSDDLPDDLDVTDDLDVVKTAIERVDVKDLAEDVADEWDTVPGRDPPRFAPPWRTSDSGASCFADSDKFVDLGEGKSGGGALKLIARSKGIINSCSDDLRGEDYRNAVEALRKEGYNIPRYNSGDGDRSIYYTLALGDVAADHGVDGDPYEDDHALLQACLHAREETPDVGDAKPPYAALIAVAEHVGLDMEDPEEKILGKTTYKVARRVFDDLDPGDV